MKQNRPIRRRSARRTPKEERIIRNTINVLVLLGAGTLYYFVFSALFDTPQEHRLREANRALERSYDELEERLDAIETVLGNVEARDRNVFNIMFESDPDTTDLVRSQQERSHRLASSNAELGASVRRRTEGLTSAIRHLYGTMAAAADTAAVKGPDRTNHIPAIQPVINDNLTFLTAAFGLRIHPFYRSLVQHNGVDFTVPENSRVFATADGRVTDVSRNSTSGITITIDHRNGYKTRYCHLNKALVRSGENITRGDIIALSGNTGLSLLPHLHYEVIHNGEPVDPLHYFFLELTPEEYRQLIRIARSGMQSFD